MVVLLRGGSGSDYKLKRNNFGSFVNGNERGIYGGMSCHGADGRCWRHLKQYIVVAAVGLFTFDCSFVKLCLTSL